MKRRKAAVPRGSYVVDRRGNYHNSSTGEFTWKKPGRVRYPRLRSSKYTFATILQGWARRKYTPDVSVKRVQKRRRR